MAVCVTLNIVSQDDTLRGAISSLREAIIGYLESINERGLNPKRMSPLLFYAEYFLIVIAVRFRKIAHKIFEEYQDITWSLSPSGHIA